MTERTAEEIAAEHEIAECATHALKVIAGGGWTFKPEAQVIRLMQQVAANALEVVAILRGENEAGAALAPERGEEKAGE